MLLSWLRLKYFCIVVGAALTTSNGVPYKFSVSALRHQITILVHSEQFAATIPTIELYAIGYEILALLLPFLFLV